jgi:Flp pilus assembly protein TadD
MLALIIAAQAAAIAQPVDGLVEAQHALTVGRIDQARAMVAAAVSKGAYGEPVDRLLADIAYAQGNYAQALSRYEVLSAVHPNDPRLAEGAGLSALHLSQVGRAQAALDKAVAMPSASWRAWNARGVIADYQGDWTTADRAYGRAAALAPQQADIANNQGWSLLLRGQWNEAIPPLERAASLNPKSARIADNLELARAAIADDLPNRRQGESLEDWAARLNDAGVIARIRGDRRRAIAAFSRALEARALWFERAANNLATVEAKK